MPLEHIVVAQMGGDHPPSVGTRDTWLCSPRFYAGSGESSEDKSSLLKRGSRNRHPDYPAKITLCIAHCPIIRVAIIENALELR